MGLIVWTEETGITNQSWASLDSTGWTVVKGTPRYNAAVGPSGEAGYLYGAAASAQVEMYQDLTIPANAHLCKFHAYAYSSTDRDTAGCWVEWLDALGDPIFGDLMVAQYCNINAWVSPDSENPLYENWGIIPDGAVTARIWAGCWRQGSGTVLNGYLDDVKLWWALDQPIVMSDNMMINGSWETGDTTGWVLETAGNVVSGETLCPDGGTWSFRDTGSGSGVCRQKVPLGDTTGKTHVMISMWMQSSGAVEDQPLFRLRIYDDTDTEIGTYKQRLGPTSRAVNSGMYVRMVIELSEYPTMAYVEPQAYAVRLSGTNNASLDDTRVQLINLANGPLIFEQPVDNRVPHNVAVTAFTVDAQASGGTLLYQWYEETDGIVVGETTKDLILTPTAADDGKVYYCTLVDTYGTVDTDHVTLEVYDPLLEKPVITIQPVDTVGYAHRVGAQFAVTATSAIAMGYQWYRNGEPLLGFTDPALDHTVLWSDAGAVFYCRVSNANGYTQSDDAHLTELQDPDIGLVNPDLAGYTTLPWVTVDAGASWRVAPSYNLLNRGIYAGGTSDSWSEYYQDVPIRSDLPFIIWGMNFSSYTDRDTGLGYYQFFEADGVTATSAKTLWHDGAQTGAATSAKYADLRFDPVDIPADSAILRFTVVHDRVSGTSNNGAMDYMRYVVDPDNWEGFAGYGDVDPLFHMVDTILTMDGDYDNKVPHSDTLWTLTGSTALSAVEAPAGMSQSMRFNGDGTCESSNATVSPGMVIGTNLNCSVTVEIWFWPDTETAEGLFSCNEDPDSNNGRFQLHLPGDGSMTLFFNGSTGTTAIDMATPTAQVIPGQWNLVRAHLGNPSVLQVNDNVPVCFWLSGSDVRVVPTVSRLGFTRASSADSFFTGYIGPVRITAQHREFNQTHTLPAPGFPVVGNDPVYDDLVLSHVTGSGSGTAITDNKGLVWTGVNATYIDTDSARGSSCIETVAGYIETTEMPPIEIGAAGVGFLHICMWAKVPSGVQTPLFFLGEAESQLERIQATVNADNTVQFYAYGSAESFNHITLNTNTDYLWKAGEWNYVEFIVDSMANKVLINGRYCSETALCAALVSPVDPVFRVGYAVHTVGLNSSALFEDVRVTYGKVNAGRRMERTYFSNQPPLTSLPRLNKAPTDGPLITTQPASTSAVDETTASFNVAATSSGGGITYQWYAAGVPIVGATADVVVVDADYFFNNGTQYYCELTDDNGTSVSLPATLTVTQIAIVITLEPVDATADDLTPVSYTVEATGKLPLGYQWYTDSDDLPISGATEATLIVTADYLTNEGERFYCAVSDGYEP